jgi:hypothetical protein
VKNSAVSAPFSSPTKCMYVYFFPRTSHIALLSATRHRPRQLRSAHSIRNILLSWLDLALLVPDVRVGKHVCELVF